MASSLRPIDIKHLEASQYMSAAGLVILLWDHILTFPDEVQLIWRARLSIAKVLFLFNRYLVPFVVIVQSHEFSGMAPHLSLPVSTSSRCKVWYSIVVSVGMLSIAMSNFLILLRLWVLWDRSPRLVLGTLTIFIVTQLLALSFAGYVIYEMLPNLYFDAVLRVCIFKTRPNKFVMLWVPGIAFELMVFLTAVWNALDRPRCKVGMTRVMYRDGSLYFFGLFALRLLNLLLCVAAPASLAFLGVTFLWSVANITLARLVLNLRRVSNDACHTISERPTDEGEFAEDEDCRGGVERTELPVLRRERTESAWSASHEASMLYKDLEGV